MSNATCGTGRQSSSINKPNDVVDTNDTGTFNNEVSR